MNGPRDHYTLAKVQRGTLGIRPAGVRYALLTLPLFTLSLLIKSVQIMTESLQRGLNLMIFILATLVAVVLLVLLVARLGNRHLNFLINSVRRLEGGGESYCIQRSGSFGLDLASMGVDFVGRVNSAIDSEGNPRRTFDGGPIFYILKEGPLAFELYTGYKEGFLLTSLQYSHLSGVRVGDVRSSYGIGKGIVLTVNNVDVGFRVRAGYFWLPISRKRLCVIADRFEEHSVAKAV